jgi:GTP-binding protein LepA
VGYITASIKNVRDTEVGDTVTGRDNPTDSPFLGYKKAVPMVFCGIFPADGSKYPDLRDSLEKLSLNDASLMYEPESSIALGFGFRCGFLGLLHLEIVQERLEREFSVEIIMTAPSVLYNVHLTNGGVARLHNPAEMPDVMRISRIEEPWIRATIIVPETYLGSVLALCEDRRGEQIDIQFMETRAVVQYHLPLNEVIYDFYDRLKSITKGYASFDYQLTEYRDGELVKVAILINGEPVDTLSMIIHADRAEKRGRALCEKLKDLIPKQLFKIAVQAAIGGKIIARATVSAYRKDVLAKCYGGDITRKRKLLDKQKEGKKRMRQFGNVDIPQKVFIEALKLQGE